VAEVERARDRGPGIRTGASSALLALAGVAWLALASPAAAQPPPADAAGSIEAWLEGQRDTLGRRCDRRAAELDVNRTLIACGSAGLWVVERSPDGSFVLAAVQDLGGDVVGLFARDGRIWAEVARLEARPVLRATGSTGSFPGPAAAPAGSPPKAAAPAAAPTAPAAAPAAAEAPDLAPEGRVTEVGIGEVVVDLGQADGVRPGDRIELSVLVTETIGGQTATDRQIAAIGVVRTVAPDFSRVDLGLNERVPLGASARLVERGKTESRLAPPRASGLWELMLRLRPFVALDGLGGGLLTQTSVAYRFESHFALAAEVHPFGFASGKGADKLTLVPAAAFLSAGYDHHVFGVGLGLGFQTVHDTEFETESGSGTLVTQRLRLGARDGLMLDLRNDVVLFHSQFDFSGFVGSGMIPVGSRAWLLFEGGGGSAGYAYGEIGLRSLLRGNGQHGSLFLSVTLGGQGVFEFRTKTCVQGDFAFPCEDTQIYAGPMLGVGVEYRL
jgi:hypothetical protein